MSRLGSSAITVKAGPNIYTGLALISFLATLAAAIYVSYQYYTLIVK